MLFIVIAMLAILALAALVMLYVAFPHRGADVPKVPWVGRVLGRVARKAPVIGDGERDALHR